MKNKSLAAQPIKLPLVTAGLLSCILTISACSNADESAAEDSAAAQVNESQANTPIDSNAETDSASTIDPAASGAAVAQSPSENTLAYDSTNTENIASRSSAPARTNSASLVTNPTQAGTPEDAVKRALDALYYGDAKDAVTYYKVDMPNFAQELANTQSAFQQTVEGVTILDTQYNGDKTKAIITGEIRLRGQSEPAPLTYELEKVEGKWKILG